MASTQITTSTSDLAFAGQGQTVEKYGSRWWTIFNDGTNLVLYYSDNDGGSWTSHGTVASGASLRGTVCRATADTRLNIAWAGTNNTSQALGYRAVTSNPGSGSPGALSTAVTVDAGGANAGIEWPNISHSYDGSQRRYWITAKKITSATNSEPRAWYVNAGSSADTAGNWSTTNFTNISGSNDANSPKYGASISWYVSGSTFSHTMMWQEGSQSPDGYEAATFDPAAGTPTPGTITTPISAVTQYLDQDSNGPTFKLAAGGASSEILLFGKFDDTNDAWDWHTSTNGTTWNAVTNGSDVAASGTSCGLVTGSDRWYWVYSRPHSATPASNDEAIYYREITFSSPTMGSEVGPVSDGDGYQVATAFDRTDSGDILIVYRRGTASAYSIRSDVIDITPAATAGRNRTLTGVG